MSNHPITLTTSASNHVQGISDYIGSKQAPRDTLMNEKAAAALLGWSVKTLQARRFKSQPPRYLKVGGRSVRYRLSDLEEFVSASVVEPMA